MCLTVLLTGLYCDKTWGRSTALEDIPKPGCTALEMVNLQTTPFLLREWSWSTKTETLQWWPFEPSRKVWVPLLVTPCAVERSLGGPGAFLVVCHTMNCGLWLSTILSIYLSIFLSIYIYHLSFFTLSTIFVVAGTKLQHLQGSSRVTLVLTPSSLNFQLGNDVREHREGWSLCSCVFYLPAANCNWSIAFQKVGPYLL